MTQSSIAQVGLLGPNGRMGKRVIALLASEFQNQAELIAMIGKDNSTQDVLGCDVVIDFSNPGAVINLASKIISIKRGPALIVASTGWQIDQRKALEEASQYVPMVISSNFSLGVLAFMEILKTASPLLDSLGYSPVITESHHRHKKDAPSGTAISLQRIISPLGPGGVQTHSVRAGEIIGDHLVTFHGPSDFIRLEHSAQNRDIFARGAIEAALWIASARTRTHLPLAHGIIPVETFFSDFKAAKASV